MTIKLFPLSENDLNGNFLGFAGCIPALGSLDLTDFECWKDLSPGADPVPAYASGSATLTFDETVDVATGMSSLFWPMERATYIDGGAEQFFSPPPCMARACSGGMRLSCDWAVAITVEPLSGDHRATIRTRWWLEIVDMYLDESEAPQTGDLFEHEELQQDVCASIGSGTPCSGGLASSYSDSGSFSVEFGAGTVPDGHLIGADLGCLISRVTGGTGGTGSVRIHGEVALTDLTWTAL